MKSSQPISRRRESFGRLCFGLLGGFLDQTTIDKFSIHREVGPQNEEIQ